MPAGAMHIYRIVMVLIGGRNKFFQTSGHMAATKHGATCKRARISRLRDKSMSFEPGPSSLGRGKTHPCHERPGEAQKQFIGGALS